MTRLISALHFMTDTLRRRLDPLGPPAPDPLDHPALRRMSLRELADLPLPRPDGADAAGVHEGEGLRPAA